MGVPIINIYESKSDYLAVKEMNTISKLKNILQKWYPCKIIVQI